MEHGAVLASVQVAPLPLRLVVVQFAGCGALGTGPSRQVFMGQVNVHLLGRQLQVHGGHAPGSLDAQNAPVQFAIFHDDWMTIHAVGVHDGRSDGGMHKGGFSGAL